MKKIFLSILFTAVLSISCSQKKPETIVSKDSVEIMTVKKDTAITVKKEFTTRSGRKLVIIETKPSISISNYSIYGIGFKTSDTIKYNLKNPMTTAYLTDLDKNGFEELYIVTKAAGPGFFLDLLGVASYEDSTFREILIPEITDEEIQKNRKFSGYLGNDSIYIMDNKIVRLFPVYESSDYNSLPAGGSRMLIYSLIDLKNLNYKDSKNELQITGVENLK